uniref:DUF4939 domain-containing protein n=1 Tax=Xiphophorus maculatus TaxID=8083 RepID=A0A3B5QYG7_XIPMA
MDGKGIIQLASPLLRNERPPASASLREVSPPMPEPYTGEIDRCRGFLLQCSLVFSSSPQSFQTDGAKISFVVGNLRGRALKWAEARSAQHNLFHRTYDSFVLEFTQTFGYSESPADISHFPCVENRSAQKNIMNQKS